MSQCSTGRTAEKCRLFKTGRYTAVAVAFAVPVLLLCIPMRRVHLWGVGGEGSLTSIAVLLPIVRGVYWCVLARTISGNNKKVHSSSFFHIRIRWFDSARKNRGGVFRNTFVWEICFIAYKNTRTNLEIYDVDSGYTHTHIYMYMNTITNNGDRKKHARENVIKGLK